MINDYLQDDVASLRDAVMVLYFSSQTALRLSGVASARSAAIAMKG